MNVKKNVKKIVALGAAALITATTFAGALAADLSNYPAPFVENGAFNGAIVVGAMAKTQDVIGAIDIGASLQAEAVTPVSTTGTSTATVSVEGGILLEDSTSQDVNFHQTIGNTLDKIDFPTLLADGELEDDDGTTYDYDQEIIVGSANVTFARSINRDFTEPVIHLDTMTDLLNFTLSFDTDANFTALDDSESFEAFGKSFTVKNVGATDEIILYASDLTETVQLGEPLTIEVDGTSYTIEVLQANAANTEVWLSVNGVTKTVSAGDNAKFGDLELYIQELFVADTAGETAIVKLFVGSEEFNLGTVNSDNTLQINSLDIDGASVFVTATNNGDVERIDFVVDPTAIDNPEYDDEYDYLLVGDTFVDPIFGFKVSFTEVVPGLTEARDEIKFSADGELTVEFTNVNGDTFAFDIYEVTSNTANMSYSQYFNTNTTVVKDGENIFIVEEDSTSSKPISIVYEYTGTDSSNVSSFKNLGTDEVVTVKDGAAIGKSTSIVTVESNTNDQVDVSGVKSGIFTASGLNVTFSGTFVNSTGGTVGQLVETTISIYEDDHGIFTSEIPGVDYTVNISVGTTSDQDDELLITAPLTKFTSASDKDGNVWYGINDFGTYAVQDDEDNQYLDLYVPFGEADFNVYLAPPNAVKVVSAAATGDAYVVNPAGLGVGILDIDAPALGSKPMIVVGGPAVNTVAAELMGNPTWEQMTETFETGKAMIKFYSAENAVLVAGWDAIETQAACNVLVNYKMYDLTGDEMEVIVTSLDNIKVNSVN